VRDAALKKTKAAEEAREALEAERDSLRSQIASLERDVAVAKQVRGSDAWNPTFFSVSVFCFLVFNRSCL
jgi:hypothetical protein